MTKLADIAKQAEDFWFYELGEATAGTYYANGAGSGTCVDYICTEQDTLWEQDENGRHYKEVRAIHVKQSDIAAPTDGKDEFKIGSDTFLLDEHRRSGPLWRFSLSRTVRSERSGEETRRQN